MADAIATLLDEIGINLNERRVTIATFTDFRKVFNTLEHAILLRKLSDLNVSDRALHWIDCTTETWINY